MGMQPVPSEMLAQAFALSRRFAAQAVADIAELRALDAAVADGAALQAESVDSVKSVANVENTAARKPS